VKPSAPLIVGAGLLLYALLQRGGVGAATPAATPAPGTPGGIPLSLLASAVSAAGRYGPQVYEWLTGQVLTPTPTAPIGATALPDGSLTISAPDILRAGTDSGSLLSTPSPPVQPIINALLGGPEGLDAAALDLAVLAEQGETGLVAGEFLAAEGVIGGGLDAAALDLAVLAEQGEVGVLVGELAAQGIMAAEEVVLTSAVTGSEMAVSIGATSGILTLSMAASMVGIMAMPFITSFLFHMNKLSKSERDRIKISEDALVIGYEISRLTEELSHVETLAELTAWLTAHTSAYWEVSNQWMADYSGAATVALLDIPREWTFPPTRLRGYDEPDTGQWTITWDDFVGQTRVASTVAVPTGLVRATTPTVDARVLGRVVWEIGAGLRPLKDIRIYIRVMSDINTVPYEDQVRRALMLAVYKAFPTGPPTPEPWTIEQITARMVQANVEAEARNEPAGPDTGMSFSL